jgi:hypothetical protein
VVPRKLQRRRRQHGQQRWWYRQRQLFRRRWRWWIRGGERPRRSQVGATAQWISSDGTVKNYVVKSSYSIAANTDFSSIVSSGAADLTIITCTGSFVGGEYTNRHVVAFVEA